MNPIRVAIIAEQVMHYRCALYRALAARDELDIEVIFLDSWGYQKRYDPTMGVEFAWNSSVLNGFKYTFAKNISPFSVKYTGADRTELETKLKHLGTGLFYLRTFLSKITIGVASILLRQHYDAVIVESYSSFGSLLAILTSKLSRKKVFLRGEAVLRLDQPLIIRILKQLYLRPLFKILDGFMYSCKNNEQYYLHYGANSKPRVFVPSAVDEEAIHSYIRNSQGCKEKIKTSLGIANQSIVVLGVGRLVERKNWLEAIKAFVIAKKSEPRLMFILVGDGPERGVIKQYISENKVQDVSLVGYKNEIDLMQYYLIADIFILTSLYDPSPKVLNEALVFGIPMIVSNKTGTAGEVCVHGINGIVYQNGDIAELADALTMLARDSECRNEFRNNSEEIAHIWSIKEGAKNMASFLKDYVQFHS